MVFAVEFNRLFSSPTLFFIGISFKETPPRDAKLRREANISEAHSEKSDNCGLHLLDLRRIECCLRAGQSRENNLHSTRRVRHQHADQYAGVTHVFYRLEATSISLEFCLHCDC